ncbi:acetate--CoA ligase [Arthrobacter sp. zg-Y820]|uniref:acetate--CoA ligase n=1 Tax=unclassified Arthrobacter TaxID=235627 RepID=UPI001E46AB75|nr:MULTISPECIES: acetate--CoA ligase [unclassified Arthrobacter]MCC9197543.1 acetate--CoA ligase [Arthrobacter sp. zg-Y820]MDK1280410.1 acetate--CoA ligase [Arthrobacter sp. zg.Y820]WIB09689.1 acetate--CoA ligase [Arthrobacter sp. zg-Y820]
MGLTSALDATTAPEGTPAAVTPATVTEPATEAERIAFWEAAARRLQWEQPWHTAHTFIPPQRLSGPDTPEADADYSVPAIEWFAGGTLNVAVNCVDRHVAAGLGGRVALHFEGEPGDRRTVTYADLQREVSRAANALHALGIGRGDRVVIYLPVLVETIVITLACARVGAVHSLVFGGFSAEALKFRVEDTGAKLLVTTDGQFRRGTAVPVKDNADAAVAGANAVEHVLVVRRTGSDISWTEGRDVWWHETVDTAADTHTPEAFDAETPLFIMYTSGTTGKPKGLVHTMGGYLTQASWSYDYLFANSDPAERDTDVHWCTADLAWVTAHTYEIYGPLANGATQVIFEGTPNTPHPGRHLEIIDRYRVTSYYTAPTLVRSLMGWFPDGVPERYDLSSIRLLGTVGEAVNPEAWRWLREQLGRGEVPVIDTWWQSETGATILSPRPTDTAFKPGCASRALPGVSTRIVDEAGNPVPPNTQGFIVVDRTGPAMARTVWGNPQRYLASYWRQYARQGWFLAGDGARYDDDGDTWILGRTDDVLNVSGHRLSTIEIESALVSHPWVTEAGVCPVADPKTGHAITAFVVLSAAAALPESGPADPVFMQRVTAELRAHIAREIGPIAKPAAVVVVPDVPKTRSGKIMRRLLTQLFEGTRLGDTTSLQNEPCIADIARVCEARRQGAGQ